ncbi:1-aminocyclopropane-1-carboxylate deaminase/D-cysteine desulfhydrase [Sulfurovum sp. zt1-1]|uniref:1-aminocyclopropane-1-carboxylate deaminase/D-cysteine desulfhydrase n=1 Tax=Sulfurovum zhangzhouensis TaxID=3019067 RepID=A0ABT7QWB5_9BACT|nr:1-aminocyclopropane-1-carboxylate deaminase/D-cysteine desulfhydrase [Sulfurovum zhangzhouensis]MDM5271122.1 1-aminocyclopropane-1-carboxylate deaminase/D-cysteine desulfhydrase [Sulfurovum zhangzhouensis]
MYQQKLIASPLQTITFEGHSFYLKRDDLLHPDFSGNKARKFYYFLTHDFPNIKKIVSYGSAQSNAMYSLSELAKMRGWEFEYYVDHIAEYLKENPHGNYKAALANGMVIKEQNIVSKEDFDSSVLFIEEGGRQKEAEYGICILAEEIMEWQKEKGIEKLNIFLPSGTGTTALFLQKHLSSNIIYTTPCVGDSEYLKSQFLELEANEQYHPTILTLEKKHHFGKLYKDNYKIWLKLQQQTGVEFDLLYDPLGWRVLLAHPEVLSAPILYIHQGGVLGNESMLPRYERKYKDIL